LATKKIWGILIYFKILRVDLEIQESLNLRKEEKRRKKKTRKNIIRIVITKGEILGAEEMTPKQEK